jgi:hypothetical protein
MQEQQKLRSLIDLYKKNLERELGVTVNKTEHISSREYQQFKQEYMPAHMSWYERLCGISEKILQLKPDQKQAAELQEAIDICHLNITPAGAVSLSFFAPIVVILLGSLFSYFFFQSMFFIVFFVVLGLSLMKILGKLPEFLANNWRLKASNQMVLCIFYVVTYMRHTPNLENAIVFAADHLAPPLALDLKKVLWDVETEKYASVKESLDAYLESWKKWNIEFIESFHLIESSLYEGEESRRLNSLDKSLEVILEETYEKMLHYAHNLQNPITMLHMLGVIMPILGLVILPLVVSFMEEAKWFHIALLYNIALPLIVYYMGKNILSQRPTGYGDTDISEENPEIKRYKYINVSFGSLEVEISPLVISSVVFMVCFLVGISPLLMHLVGIQDFGFGAEDGNSPCGYKFCFLEYKLVENPDGTTEEQGPFGLGAAVISLFIPLGVGLLVGVYYRLRSKDVYKIRERAKQLELEFAAALFQLGNRLGDNLPVEIAVEKVSSTMEGTISGNFFKLVSMNQRRLGMGIEDAIFDKNRGALVSFPSSMIESSMKVLTQSIKKGPRIAAQALTNVSRYIKEIHKVNERLRDIMADIISSMKSQISFLAPAIAGVVIGITSMVTTILSKLGQQLADVTSSLGSESAAGGVEGLLTLFGEGIPTYQFQIIVGLYVVQIVYILTIMANGIENGADKLNEEFLLGRNIIKSTILYCTIALIVMILFNYIAGQILTSSLSV